MAGPADAAAAAVVVGVAAAAADLCATNVKDTDTWLATAPLPTDGIKLVSNVTTRGISPEIARIRRSSVTNVEKWATWRVTVPKNSTIENDLAFRRIERWTL